MSQTVLLKTFSFSINENIIGSEVRKKINEISINKTTKLQNLDHLSHIIYLTFHIIQYNFDIR